MIWESGKASFNNLFLIPLSKIITDKPFPLFLDLDSWKIFEIRKNLFDIVIS